MATDFKSIPIIDIGPLLAKCDDPEMAQDPGVSEVVNQLDQACREAGFFYVKGHGIPDSLLKEVKNLTHEFFQLPYEEKLKIKMTPATGYRGYQRTGENITKGVPDIHEAIDCYKEIKPGMYGALGKPMEGCNLWPLDPPKLEVLMEEYISLCTDLSRKIMRGIALALGGSPYEFEGERAGDAFWVMRLIGYPGISSQNGTEMPKNDIGCGAHTDYGNAFSSLGEKLLYNQRDILSGIHPRRRVYLKMFTVETCCPEQVPDYMSLSDKRKTIIGLLTLVNQDEEITALQVRNLSGEWISAPPVPGTFVCNIGDMLKVYSNGLYESTLHQVVNNSAKYRVSVAYFYETNFDTAVEPLDICKQRAGGPGAKKFGRAVYGEHLVSKVLTNFVS